MKKILLIAVILLLLSCEQRPKIFRKSEFLMDTIVTVTVVSEDESKASQAIERVFRELKTLEGLLNVFDPKSEVSEVNRNSGKVWTLLQPDTVHLLKEARGICDLTEGYFDITVGAVSLLYDFHRGIAPSREEIQKALPLVDCRGLLLRDSKAMLRREGMRIDPGGITKGYAVDRAVEVLRAEGIRAGLVALAGDIRGFGSKPDGSGWKVGIRDPWGGREEVFAYVELSQDMAISTSGNYERFFIKNGRLYHHILNPKTGLPAEGLKSVTVIGPSATYTDALSTAVFVMGLQKGTPIAESKGYEVVAIDENGRISMSRRAEEMVKILYEPRPRGDKDAAQGH